jgi:phosphatidylglycerophosphate synthase
MATQGLRGAVKVRSLGKWKTAFQMLSTCLLLIFVTDLDEENKDGNLIKLFGPIGKYAFDFCLGTLNISAILAVLSGWEYVKAAKVALDDRYETILGTFLHILSFV